MTTPHPLPIQGTPWPELERELADAAKNDVAWRRGRAPMFIHYAGDDVLDVAKQAYEMYFSENGLGLRAFGSLQKFESEVVAMGLDLLHGGDGTRGAMTTGGTESIMLAVKAARDHAREQRGIDPGSARIVLPYSAHPAFDKAAHFLGLTTVRIPLRADFTADPVAMAAAITPDTVLMVGSAPAYPHGVMDPIGEIAGAASAHGIWMHVDACVGGYIAPFAQKLGLPVAPFDFAVPGVTSISADLHKYGYAAKGASTLFFRDAEHFRHMGYAFDRWPRGQYYTHTLVGTRAGGAIAAAWAVMRYLGEAGYLRITERILATRRALEAGLAPLGLHALGRPELSILAYGSPAHDIAALSRGLMTRGWLVGNVTAPPGIHMMLNLTHEPVVGEYVRDVAAALADAPAAGAEPVIARY
ncbi:MAG: aspartate aminotransferase family protein [Proteobacteria bacterium]|nr:aspartate aminotransferase family protein [Pseudomonadota bacterium]